MCICFLFLLTCCYVFFLFFCSSRRRHTRCALVTGVQTCALPISCGACQAARFTPCSSNRTAQYVSHSPRFLALSKADIGRLQTIELSVSRARITVSRGRHLWSSEC